ncbi:MAG: DinB family protein [Bacteroidia bacterium]
MAAEETPKAFPAYYNYYISLSEGDLVSNMRKAHDTTQIILSRISDEDAEKSYAEGKWTIKELIQHLIDSERIFAFRALSIARGEQTPLPGYEHNDYVTASDANRRTMYNLMREFACVRDASIALFESFSPAMLAKKGIANKTEATVESIGRVIVGHEIHHMNIIKERYL